ncbi:hypothetical protein HJC23_009995 [Cyclotella cryptica]|uniref:HMG box domain-containing protein n=1 Tax=Cyclotella cryptica TaxID=29204 RepID=A0ABD3QEY5_9STRA|eukprot:CCRYP_007767-RA/>CCRYP_007767-RA protein AED:0.00 eAED:0.00 QI:1338/1/1/1/1/1/2/126/217
MAPATPQSAYHLFFRFYKNVTLHPCLQKSSINDDNTNSVGYKHYIQTVLDANLDDPSLDKNSTHEKFIGNKSFAGMSQEVSKKWKEVDPLTRSIFIELANEDRQRYKKELFDSYQSFAKNQHVSLQVPLSPVDFNHGETKSHPEEQVIVQVREVARSTPIHVPDVDMSDDEIVLIAINLWGLNRSVMQSLPVQGDDYFVSDEDLSNFLAGTDWNTTY